MATGYLSDIHLYLRHLEKADAEIFAIIGDKVEAYRQQLYTDIFNVSIRAGEIPTLYIVMQLNYIASQSNIAFQMQQELDDRKQVYTAFELYMVLLEKIHMQLLRDFPMKAQYEIYLSLRTRKDHLEALLQDLELIRRPCDALSVDVVKYLHALFHTTYQPEQWVTAQTTRQLRAMMATLIGCCNAPENFNERLLANTLITFNINTAPTYNLCKRIFLLDDLRKEDMPNHYLTLQQRKRQIQQCSVAYRVLDSAQPGLKSQLLKFIKYELKSLQDLNERVVEHFPNTHYKVSFSVKQLAFYMFLNAEAGIITEQRAKNIHQYIVDHVTTEGTQHISEKSLKNAYYLHAPADVKKVLEKIDEMRAIAEKRY